MVWLLAINAQEISALIKKQIENFQPNFDVTETGVVTYIGCLLYTSDAADE